RGALAPGNLPSTESSRMRAITQPVLFASILLAPLSSAWMSPARAQERAPTRQSSLSPLAAEAVDLGRAAPTQPHHVIVGLALRNGDDLEAFLNDVQDPASPNYARFLTQEQFNAVYAPTEAEEAAVVAHLEGHGLRVTERVPNRLLVGARGSVVA